ncbi:MAG: hypothetical protein QM775_12260 [Pirellulales bacterium]
MLESAGIATMLVADQYVAPLLQAGLAVAGLAVAGLPPQRLTVLTPDRNDAAAREVVASWRDMHLQSREQCSHVIFIERVRAESSGRRKLPQYARGIARRRHRAAA